MAACGKMPLLESCLLGYVRLWSQNLQSKKRSIKREGFGGRKIGREILKQDANNNIQVFFEFLFQIFYGLKNFFSKFISLSRLIRHYWVSAFHLTQEASPTPTQPDPRKETTHRLVGQQWLLHHWQIMKCVYISDNHRASKTTHKSTWIESTRLFLGGEKQHTHICTHAGAHENTNIPQDGKQ